MSIKHIIAIVVIFMAGVFGWVVLGTAAGMRAYQMSDSLSYEVRNLWGEAVTQHAPSFKYHEPGTGKAITVMPEANTVNADLELEQRKKGVFWYPLYQVAFSGEYRIFNRSKVAQTFRMHFAFPSERATYDDFGLWLDGKSQEVDIDTRQGLRELLEMPAESSRVVKIAYTTRGTHEWRYDLSAQGRVRNLDMTVQVNTDNIDFTVGSLSPMEKKYLDDGRYQLRWQAKDLITRQNVGVEMPEKLNPGPLASRIAFFAPVCLLFFFVLITALGILRSVVIHPMHYLFVTGGFFAFHLLFAYLVDIINVHIAFGLSSITSIALVVLYLKAALAERFPWKAAFAGQVGYLILFSYSFFIDGMTGLTVTIGSIATLAVLMVLTVKTDWSKVFAAKPKTAKAEPAVTQATVAT